MDDKKTNAGETAPESHIPAVHFPVFIFLSPIFLSFPPWFSTECLAKLGKSGDLYSSHSKLFARSAPDWQADPARLTTFGRPGRCAKAFPTRRSLAFPRKPLHYI
jgi:hypothetical protein